MKRSLALTATALLLTACTPAVSGPLTLPLQERLRNPLVAERYWSEMAEHMADFTRLKDPILKDAMKASVIEAERTRALDRVAQARTLKSNGIYGGLQPINRSEDIHGQALLLENTLYFSSDFITLPNPSIRVMLSTVVDPREPGFPDATSIDLGELQTAYGAQQYEIPDGKNNKGFRTVALYDSRLNRLLGFGQLSP